MRKARRGGQAPRARVRMRVRVRVRIGCRAGHTFLPKVRQACRPQAPVRDQKSEADAQVVVEHNNLQWSLFVINEEYRKVRVLINNVAGCTRQPPTRTSSSLDASCAQDTISCSSIAALLREPSALSGRRKPASPRTTVGRCARRGGGAGGGEGGVSTCCWRRGMKATRRRQRAPQQPQSQLR